MELAACIPHTELPGTSRLFADYCYHFDRLAGFYRHNPHDPASFQAAAGEIEYPDARRAAMVQALTEQGNAKALLDRLAKPGTVAVVTGQQVGLFSGPVYTIYKALTAVRLAEDLTARGIDAVPVFWLATEDHDFDEAAHVWVYDSSFQPVRLSVSAESASHNLSRSGMPSRARPAGNIVLSSPPVDQLRAAFKGFPFGEEVCGWVAEAYPAGATLGDGFRDLLKRLLGRIGVLTLNPLDPRIRAIGAPLMRQALERGGELNRDLLDRGRALEAAGYHSQVLVDAKTSLLFLLENGERATLRRKDSEGRALADRALAERAMDLSPNALLRPVWQDYMLPTVAYVGGPAEIAYFAQSRVIYDRLLGRMPVVASRCGCTLLDAYAAKLFQRYGIGLRDTLTPENALRERIGRVLTPDTVARSLDDTSEGIHTLLDQLRGALEGFDHTLAQAVGKSQAKMAYQLEKTRRKIGREVLHRNSRADADAGRLTNLLYPHRHLQERFYSILPFLAQHGLDTVERIHHALKPDCVDHRVLPL